MKNIAALAPVVLIAALAAVPVMGQMKDAKPQAAPAASGEKGMVLKQGERPAARKGSRSLANVDARHCLQQTTNMAIHRCAEKYRPR
jgi:hypothetical protein